MSQGQYPNKPLERIVEASNQGRLVSGRLFIEPEWDSVAKIYYIHLQCIGKLYPTQTATNELHFIVPFASTEFPLESPPNIESESFLNCLQKALEDLPEGYYDLEENLNWRGIRIVTEGIVSHYLAKGGIMPRV